MASKQKTVPKGEAKSAAKGGAKEPAKKPATAPIAGAPTWIHKSLHASTMNVSDLIPDDKNARTHSGKNLQAIVDSLSLHGQMLPLVVDAKNRVLVGNARLRVIRENDLPLVPGDEKSKGRWPVVAVLRHTGSAKDGRALALSDNRTAELGSWNYETLAASLRELMEEEFNLTRLGWEEHEFGPLLEGDFKPPPLTELPSGAPGQHHGHSVVLDDRQWSMLEKCREMMTKQDGGRSKPGMAEVVEWLASSVLKAKP